MGKVTCSCLNVKICIKNTELSTLDVTLLEPQPESQHSFFSQDIAEVQLNLEGIKVEHPSLLRKHISRPWLVYECVNCKVFTHAVNSTQANNNTVLVNKQLQSSASAIDGLSQSAEYSPLYKIILGNRVDNRGVPQHMHAMGVQQSGKYEDLQKTLTTIQQQLNKFLIEEEAVMEERIRQYEQSQRSAYAELQSKARRDKNTLINLVLTAQQLSQTDESEQSPENRSTVHTEGASLSQPENTATVQSHAPPSPDTLNLNHGNHGHQRVAPPVRKTQSDTTRSARSTQRTQQYYSQHVDDGSPDADGVFELDPVFTDDVDRPFYESEEETEDTDDSSVTEESEQTYQRNNKAFFSTSVPINMPVWQPFSKRTPELQQHKERRQEAAPDMENMAASIKALARSVHADGAEIFGERPRPRLNVKDFGNV